MARNLTAGMLAALSAPVVRPFYAVECEFSGGTVRANSTIYALTINGSTSLGVGRLGGVAPIEETTEGGAYQMALKLWGVPTDLIAVALTQRYQGRPARIFFGLLDDNHALIPDPFLFFVGRMDTMRIDLGQICTVTLMVENREADWDRPRTRRYTDEDQQDRFPGDGFFRYVTSLQDKQIRWGQQ